MLLKNIACYREKMHVIPVTCNNGISRVIWLNESLITGKHRYIRFEISNDKYNGNPLILSETRCVVSKYTMIRINEIASSRPQHGLSHMEVRGTGPQFAQPPSGRSEVLHEL